MNTDIEGEISAKPEPTRETHTEETNSNGNNNLKSFSAVDKLRLTSYLPWAKRVYHLLPGEDQKKLIELIEKFAPDYYDVALDYLESGKDDSSEDDNTTESPEPAHRRSQIDDDDEDEPISQELYRMALLDAVRMHAQLMTPGYIASQIRTLYHLDWDAQTVTYNVNQYLRRKHQQELLKPKPLIEKKEREVGIIRKAFRKLW